MFIDLNNLNGDLEKKELEFRQLILEVRQEELLRKELDTFFKQRLGGEKEFKDSYWRWYVRVTWDLIFSLKEDDLVNVAVGKQIPMAILLDYQVLNDILRYLGMQTYTDMDMRSLYLKIKKSFLESNAVVGVWQGKEVTVAELAKEILRVSDSNDTLVQAEFESKLRQIMFPDDLVDEEYVVVDPDVGVQRFIELSSMFNDITEEDIGSVVDSFLNPEHYQNSPFSIAATAPALTTGSALGNLSEVVAVNEGAQITSSEAKELETLPPQIATSLPVSKPEVIQVELEAVLTPDQIKSQIESQFKKDADGNFIDIEGVMEKLSELAEKNNDPKIAEMIYFDEQENKFKWSI